MVKNRVNVSDPVIQVRLRVAIGNFRRAERFAWWRDFCTHTRILLSGDQALRISIRTDGEGENIVWLDYHSQGEIRGLGEMF